MPQKNFDEYAILLRDDDHVAVLKRPVKAGDELVNGKHRITATKTIGAGHKIALAGIADGEAVRKYGQTIGFAKGRIEPGEHVHVHNLLMKDFGRDYQFSGGAQEVKYYPPDQMRYFQGYIRPGGRVGTRNY